ncbi:hypothetical protein FJV76_13790 [Mesorhizobium sp. WSM4303]|uniref:hypothetical protein n=1 Tax=unclassified Mesorhizobium TaxID=325217 RepID=UPI00115CFDD8|nr:MULTISPECIES: hypothetical protein [unclassified Mesorhizobium]TRC98363.1 hypothetical protein FJV77_07900 [Mesorhizobium sp. WSM4306]TRD04340.1 hypothetical protein FJV76_13790 [Mesorhizobium sp. WSM4303]
MAVANNDQERMTYARMYGAQARKDGKERQVPPYWQEFAEAWLAGFDGHPSGGPLARPISDELEAELDEAGVGKPPRAGTNQPS